MKNTLITLKAIRVMNKLHFTTGIILGLLMLAVFPVTLAQDGEAIFKSKCNSCHIMGKDGTGPNLQDVKSRWDGEEDYLYEWVLNAPKVFAEGKSQRALEVKNYSPTDMPIQDVTLEQAKAVIDYVDTWSPPAVAEAPPGEAGETVVYVADYEKNLTLFYVLLAVIGFLLLAIRVVGKSTSGLIQSDKFKEKILEIKNAKNNKLGGLGLLILSLGVAGNASALSTTAPAAAQKDNLWLYVDNSDLYALLIIALVLLGMLLHMVRMFYGVLKVIIPDTEPSMAERLRVRKKKQSSITRILTGAIPIEEEHKIDLGHDYDGIRELDNPMPPWWLAGFFISIVFAVIYMFHYHVLGTGDLQEAEYAKVMERENAKVQAYLKAQAMDVTEENATLMTSNEDLMKGKALFVNNCAVCHKEDGRGEAGPNLTDDYWIYGGDIKDVFRVIKKGAPNGMPEHQSKFNPIQIQQVSSYVLSMDYVSPEQGGKPAEGDYYGAREDEQEEIDAEAISEDEPILDNE